MSDAGRGAAAAPIVRIVDVHKSFGAVEVLCGISLTVNEVERDTFGVNIIPHTTKVTTWGALKAGDKVNIEIDMLARYLARLKEFA
jgi:riboflavin synthase alpha subunit